jgi:predicted ferric reductase
MQATLALFGFGMVARVAMMLVVNLRTVHKATMSLQGGWVRVEIPTHLHWSPGMHIFIRFLRIRPFESHPFTISSIPSPDSEDRNKMVFWIRPETGFTSTLADFAATTKPEQQFLTILDGPYGETGTNSLRAYDRVLLLAGGTGITFIVSILEDLVRAMKQNDGPCKTVDLVWAVKNDGRRGNYIHTEGFTHYSPLDAIKSFSSVLLNAKMAAKSAGATVTISVHLTADVDQEESVGRRSTEKEISEDENEAESKTMATLSGRPNIPQIIADGSHTWGGHVGVAGVHCLPFFV